MSYGLQTYISIYSSLITRLRESQTEEHRTLLEQEEESAEYRIVILFKKRMESFDILMNKIRKREEAHQALNRRILPSYDNERSSASSTSKLILEQTVTLLRATIDPSFSNEIKELLNAREKAHSEVTEASETSTRASETLESEISACGGEESVYKGIVERCRVVESVLSSYEVI
jgi:predicted CopG family antitoxin